MTTSLSDDPIAPDDAASLLRDLCARLIGGPSATVVLDAWCRERGIGPGSDLVAHAVQGTDRPLSSDQRARLELSHDAPVRYRRVRLTRGAHVLSEAENWYVPARLTAAMNRLLETSETPFGRVVHPLAPARRNLGLRMLPAAAAPKRAGSLEPLFAIEALLLRQDGVPLCEVAEVYTGAVLKRG